MNSVSLSLKPPSPFSIATAVSLLSQKYSQCWNWPILVQNLIDQRLHQLDRLFHSGFNRRAQSHLTLFASESLRFAANQQYVLHLDIHRPGHAKNALGIHRVGFDHRRRSIRRIAAAQIRFDDVQRTRSLALRTSVHQDGRFVAVLQRIGQVETSNAKIGYAYALRQVNISQAADNLDAKRVVAEKDVADAGY